MLLNHFQHFLPEKTFSTSARSRWRIFTRLFAGNSTSEKLICFIVRVPIGHPTSYTKSNNPADDQISVSLEPSKSTEGITMKAKQQLVALTSALVLTLSGALHAANITSTFDVGTDGWAVADIIQPITGIPTVSGVYTPSFTPGGNPGGAIEQGDPSGNAWYFSAPSAFLGNRSASLFGTLSWDLAVDRSSQGGTDTFEQLILSDGITALYYFDTGPSPANQWRAYSVPLAGTSFRVGSRIGPLATDSELQSVLSNLGALYILGDWTDGLELGRLDNVVLTQVPEPSTYPLLVIGGLAMLVWQKRRQPHCA